MCTVAAPPTHDAFVNTTENTLARLRKTERQFRENAILAALDVEARQLFTFYKKVDITAPKDQKTLLLKFGHVLRSNTCTIAYKTAARLPDLMKPEQARLYRLFITAVLSSVQLLSAADTTLRPIGSNLYLVEATPPANEQGHPLVLKKWHLYRVDMQVILSGHIILTIAKDERLSFLSCQDYTSDMKDVCSLTSDFAAVFLAPIGRIARLRPSNIDPNANVHDTLDGGSNDGDQTLDARREMWKHLLPPWLKEHMDIRIEESDVPWIEVEVPVAEINGLSNDSQQDLVTDPDQTERDSITWKTIFWPPNLCFLLDRNRLIQEKPQPKQDPMQFVLDWILGVGSGGIKPETRRQSVMEEDDEPLFAEDGTFDDPEHFQPFGPPAFPASQTIYPTPPDVGMTHATPGMSSVDGVAATPANLPATSADSAQRPDEDMPDYEDAAPTSAMSGYYDEDLFEEMPDDNFGQETNGDEPNWDFFDRPGGQSKPSRSASHGRNEGSTSRGDPKPEKIDASDPKTQIIQPSGPQSDVKMDKVENSAMPNIPPFTRTSVSPDHVVSTKSTLPPKKNVKDQTPTKRAPPLWPREPDDKSTVIPTPRRRSSAYEGLKSLPSVSKNDIKYQAKGDYWFDPSPVLSKVSVKANPISIFQRPPSSASNSDDSMTTSCQSPEATSSGPLSPVLGRPWAKYDPDSPEITSHKKEVDKMVVSQDAQQLLSILKLGLVEPPSPSDFELNEPSPREIPMSTSERLQHIAQLLVDQMSQTSLNAYRGHQNELPDACNNTVEIQIDLSGINTSVQPSNLFQLTNLKGDHGGPKLQGRIVKLRPNQICLRRLDRPLTASISILPFWDTLNLQPHSGAKDVTAFCIHPQAENVRDGSSNMMQRLADSYTTCGLGTHTIGGLQDFTGTGCIPWSPNDPGENTLIQTARLVGDALAHATNIKGTVMIYMISGGESPNFYLEMCFAFYILFESFLKARTDSLGITDIALQIIPQNFIANPETLVVPPQTAYNKLALEVYNRLPPANPGGTLGSCGSAVTLSRSENSVQLQLTPMYGSPMEKNGPCLHLAYALSSNKKWLVAVWTDELGHVALTMSYCCQILDSGKRRPRHDVFQDLWEVSQDLMNKVRGPWRLAVVKHGYYEIEELHEWHGVFDSAPVSQKRCLLLLLSSQPSPELAVFASPGQGKGTQAGVHNQYGTPASTPQASITSPDQIVPATPTPSGSSFMNASTPPDGNFDPNVESDLSLVDVSEESWGIVLPYGLNQSRNMTELRPSQITGFLMKRKGSKGDDGHNMIEVSLVKSTINLSNKSREASIDDLLEDVIRQYRGLVTLGATRGCVDPNRECIPWHIATAIRGARILEKAM